MTEHCVPSDTRRRDQKPKEAKEAKEPEEH